MVVRISRPLLARLLSEASTSPDREVCGLLFGVAGRKVTAVQPCRNVAEDPASRFEIDPADLIAAHKAQRRGGPRLIGCYHSHPNGAGGLSAQDREAAGMTSDLWLVLSGGRVRAWLGDGKGDFQEVRIETVG